MFLYITDRCVNLVFISLLQYVSIEQASLIISLLCFFLLGVEGKLPIESASSASVVGYGTTVEAYVYVVLCIPFVSEILFLVETALSKELPADVIVDHLFDSV